jgi:hypothetical protein
MENEALQSTLRKGSAFFAYMWLNKWLIKLKRVFLTEACLLGANKD